MYMCKWLHFVAASLNHF